MKQRNGYLSLFTSLSLLLATTRSYGAMGSTFTYQGHLVDGGRAAQGNYDFTFQLFTAFSGPVQVGPVISKDDLPVSNGLFTVDLDFGPGAFAGDARWLEVAVRPGTSSGSYTSLVPRQAITQTPYAIFSTSASSATTATSVPWSALTGVPSGFADGIDNDTTYSAGVGLDLAGNTFSIGPAKVVNTMLGLLSISTGNLQDNAVTAAKLATNAVSTTNIASGQIVRSLNNLRDEVVLLEGTNIIFDIDTNLVTLAISAKEVWKTTGNSGTTSNDFLGTLDDQPLELRVSNARALRLEPVPGGVNLIGGRLDNAAKPGVFGATIGGGGGNYISDPFGTIGGGAGNRAGNDDVNFFLGRYATVAGGENNFASGEGASVSGGQNNAASVDLATVGGGGNLQASGYACVIAGGGGFSSSLGRQVPNRAMGSWSVISGGSDNNVTNEFGTIAGGASNISASQNSTVSGGLRNSALGSYATVPGGRLNSAHGKDSFAAGNRAKALHSGAFVWADASQEAVEFESAADNEFAVRATGGARFVSAIDGNGTPTAGVSLPSGGGSWNSLSDRNVKDNFAKVSPREILDRLASLPIQTWNYKTQDPAIRHIGVIAQDFSEAFKVGEDERHISSVDADGVAMAAIQGLYEIVREKDAEMKKKNAEIESLKERLVTLENTVIKLADQK